MNLIIARSSPIEMESVPASVDRFERHFSEALFERYHRRLPYGSVNRLWPKCYDLEAIETAGLTLTIAHDIARDEGIASFVRFLREHGSELLLTGLRWDVHEAERPRQVERHSELWLSVGWSYYSDWNAGYYYCGLDLGAASPAAVDKRYRQDLFRRAIQGMGLEQAVRVHLEGETLTISAAPPWRIRFTGAEIDGANPFAFRVCGFVTFEKALQHLQEVVRQIAREIKGITFHAMMLSEDYTRLRESLNQAAEGWEVDISGILTSKADALLRTGTVTEGTPERIPAFEWTEGEDGQELRFYGDVVVTPQGACLEITSDCGDPEVLLEKARAASDFDWSLAE